MIDTFEEARSFIEKYYPNSSEKYKMTKIGLLAKFGADLLEKQAEVNKSAIGGVSGEFIIQGLTELEINRNNSGCLEITVNDDDRCLTKYLTAEETNQILCFLNYR